MKDREKRPDHRSTPRVCAVCGKGGNAHHLFQDKELLDRARKEFEMQGPADSPWIHDEPCYKELAHVLGAIGKLPSQAAP